MKMYSGESQTNATSVIMSLLMQAIWGDIWKWWCNVTVQAFTHGISGEVKHRRRKKILPVWLLQCTILFRNKFCWDYLEMIHISLIWVNDCMFVIYFCSRYEAECDIRENFDTNECTNIFVSTKLHEWISEYIHINFFDTSECPNKYSYWKLHEYSNIRLGFTL